jgi:GDPmannose 4,6-dehydratase
LSRKGQINALILGVNGQDGSYLAEELLARGQDVTGAGRQAASRWVAPSRFRYVTLDIADHLALDGLLDTLRPQVIYHLAAIHGPAGHAYEVLWHDTLAVNLASLHVCLEHLRTRTPGARLFYPSSLKAFGSHPPLSINEKTPRVSGCLYGITKNAAYDLIQYYRTHHNLWVSLGFFFNHDSPRRPENYFLSRLAARLAAQRSGKEGPILATLDFWCDWGNSKEFMELVADMMQVQHPNDLIFATGRPVHAAALAGRLDRAAGLSGGSAPPADEPPFRADVSRMVKVLGRAPRHGAFEVAAWILQERYGISIDARGGASS